MSLTEFQLIRPRSLDEAVTHLAKHSSNTRLLAGGTDIIPSMRQKLFEPQYMLDVRHLGELKGIRTEPGNDVVIGALTTLSQIEKSPYLKHHYPVLAEAAARTG